MSVGIDINAKDESGDTPLSKLCQLYRDYGHEIKKRVLILIEFDASLEAKDNNGIDVKMLLKDNDLFTENDVYNSWQPNKRRRVYE